jgi:hypothetical protein
MSFSEPKSTNPATKFYDFRDGKFQYWDKQAEKNVIHDLPIYFVVLDELSTISGYCERHNCGIYANEVHRINEEVLHVKTFKGGESIIGLYNDIKDSAKVLGGKFTKSVYAMLLYPDGERELVNFKFRGAAFSSWIDKKINPEKYAVGIEETVEESKGNTTYQVPVFSAFTITPEQKAKAILMDKELQSYLKTYKAQQAEKETSEAVDVEVTGEGVHLKTKEDILRESKEKEKELDDLPEGVDALPW